MRDTDEGLVADIRSAYEDGADGWATGPAAVYRLLAAALVEAAPARLDGRRVLDLGAGTGVASDVLTAAGARPVGVDLAHAMIAHRQTQRPPGVVGDAAALPFRAGAFEAVVAAFSQNHVPDPQAALAECRRVVRAGGWVLLAGDGERGLTAFGDEADARLADAFPERRWAAPLGRVGLLPADVIRGPRGSGATGL